MRENMDLEHRFELTNYRKHPTDPKYYVFTFDVVEKATFFEHLLIEHKLWFEKFEEEDRSRVMFGVHRNDYKKVLHLNHLTTARYKKPFIPNVYFRWFLIALSFSIVILAFYGYFKG